MTTTPTNTTPTPTQRLRALALIGFELALVAMLTGCTWRPSASQPAPVASTPLLPCEWMAGEQPIWAIDDVDLEEWPACDRGEGVGR